MATTESIEELERLGYNAEHLKRGRDGGPEKGSIELSTPSCATGYTRTRGARNRATRRKTTLRTAGT